MLRFVENFFEIKILKRKFQVKLNFYKLKDLNLLILSD